MSKLKYITLREKPQLMETSASWFNSKWGVPKEAYLECMQAYLSGEKEFQGIGSYQGVDREICRYVYRIAG